VPELYQPLSDANLGSAQWEQACVAEHDYASNLTLEGSDDSTRLTHSLT